MQFIKPIVKKKKIPIREVMVIWALTAMARRALNLRRTDGELKVRVATATKNVLACLDHEK